MAVKLSPLLILSVFLALIHRCESTLPESKGFSLKLVRRQVYDAPQSTVAENELIDPSREYIIRPALSRSLFLFTIDASIGTPGKKHTFIFDTGSSLTWMQCMPCTNCFKQDYPLFDPKKSSSYKKLPPKHSLARYFKRSNSNPDWNFNVSYVSGQSVSGIGSVDNIAFKSTENVTESIKGFVFGCSNNFRGKFGHNTQISGIMGMDRSPLSLIRQIGPKPVLRFSYCLPKIDSPTKSTFLRFGKDIDIKKKGKFQKTGFIKSGSDFKVRILAVSIENRKLNVPKSAFSSGCGLDVGSATTHLDTRAFNAVLSAVTAHFNPLNYTRFKDPSFPLALCYHLKSKLTNLPSMTLHFPGAKYEVGPENLFISTNDRFCLALIGKPGFTVLGANQQQNMRLIYDVGDATLQFAKEDCSQDKA